jgi:O-antigen biosynthesis protein
MKPVKNLKQRQSVISNRPSMFWAPEQLAQVSAWFEHGPFAFWITDVLRPSQFVELGTHTGYSFFCFCQTIKKLKLSTKCVAVDTWKGDEHSYFYGEEIFDSVVRTNEKYKRFSRLLRSTFDDALSKFPSKSIDLLHIDGRHFYDDVKHDYESWLPKLTDHAIVLFHDTNVRERDFGVWKLFKELKRKHTSFEFLHGHGLGVLAPKKVPLPMKDFFGSNHNEVQAIFASLGGAITTRWALQESQTILEKTMLFGGQMEDLAKENLKMSENMRLLQVQNSELHNEREQLKTELHNEREQIKTELYKEREYLKSESASRSQTQLAQRSILGAIAKLHGESHRNRSLVSKLADSIHATIYPSAAKLYALRKSIYFDADWYLSSYKDVAGSGMDPAIHYLEYGAQEGRDPGPFFSTRDYQAKFPQTSGKGQNPVLHSICPAWLRARKLHPAKPVDYITNADRAAIQKHIANLSLQPLISVVMPAYNTPEKFLRQAIASVQAQLYTNWELCIANDASPDKTVATVLDECAAKDKRIKIIHRTENGNISAATNSALELATGEFIALMDHDDLLHETALYEVAAEINVHPEVDILYSDEDQIDENGHRSGGYYKTDFNPELFLSQNMVSHLGVYRTSLIRKIGGLRVGFEGSQDYDLMLRAWAASTVTRVRHIPSILYHWRRGAATSSFSESQLERCTTAARKALQEFLDLEGEGAKIVPAPIIPNFSRVVRKLPSPAPLVSIIVPTKDQAKLLEVCINGLLENTAYPKIEVIIIDHESRELKTKHLLNKLKRDPRVKILPYSGDFNFSKMNNMAANLAKGSVLALVNNDIEIIEPNWLDEMVSHAVRPEVGAVGAKLIYSNGTIQHAGVVVGLGAFAGHAFHFVPKSNPCYMGHAMLARAVSAVTGACLVVRKSIYFEVGGLNEEHLAVAFNDVDLCLKIQAKGYRNVWTPFAELIHHESISRGHENTPEKKARFIRDTEYMHKQWLEVFEQDPFYNVNLTGTSPNYDVVTPSRRRKPWAHFLSQN